MLLDLHMERVRIKSIVNTIRVFGTTPSRRVELAVAWARYSDIKKSLNKSKNLLSTGYNIQ